MRIMMALFQRETRVVSSNFDFHRRMTNFFSILTITISTKITAIKLLNISHEKGYQQMLALL